MNRLKNKIVIAICFASSILCETSTDTNYRLNAKVLPYEYEITIKPYFDTGDETAFTFDGEVSIKVKTAESNVNQIKFHAQDLNFTASDVNVKSGNNDVSLDADNPLEFNQNYSFVYVNLAKDMDVNKEYVIHIVYTGRLRKDYKGLYRESYKENGETKWLASSQMESTNTRKVFPCWDEPGYKAIFTLIIDRPENYSQSLTNTKLQEKTALNNGYVRERFYPTPVMSSYLVALVVSQFDHGGRIQESPRQYGIWVRPQAVNQTELAFEFGKKVVDAMSAYTGIDYYSVGDNLNLNQAGVPGHEGAMENWGLIIYRESFLTYDPKECGPLEGISTMFTMAHELAHQWFGNLVTCHWWSDTWLNEGFATYFENFIVSLIDAEMGALERQQWSAKFIAAMTDEKPDATALTNNSINSPDEVLGHFGIVTYKKGGSVISMIYHLIGDEAFRKGLNHYFTNRKLGSVTPSMLYEALDKGVSYSNSMALYPGFTVANVMEPWIVQPGHPVVTVALTGSNEVTLTQNRFYSKKITESSELYPIPVTVATSSNPKFGNTKPDFIMVDKKHNMGNISDDEWIILNIQDTGYYRVNYDKELWRRIIEALHGEDRTKIHHLNRAQIITDLFEFAHADMVSFDMVFDALDILDHETEYTVWSVAVNYLVDILNSIPDPEANAEIAKFVVDKMEYILNELGFDERNGDDFKTLTLRSLVAELACNLGHTGCLEHALSLFKSFRANGTYVPPSLRSRVYCEGLKQGTEEDFKALSHRMSSTNYVCERDLIQNALTCTKHKDSIRSFLDEMVAEGSNYGKSDILTVLNNLLSMEENYDIAFSFLQNNVAAIRRITQDMPSVITLYGAAVKSQEEEAELREWFATCTMCKHKEQAALNEALKEKRSERERYQRHQAKILAPIRTKNRGLALNTPALAIGCAAASILLC